MWPVLWVSLLSAPPIGFASEGCEAPYPFLQNEPALGKALRERVVASDFSSLVEKGVVSVAVVDLTDEVPAYAALNPNRMFYAASLPKIVLLLGMAKIANDEGAWSKVKDRCEAMICRSSNKDASWVFDRLGLDTLEALVRRPGLCFYGNRHGGLWVGRSYRPGGPRRPDPVAGVTHGATVRQVARFYTLLDRGLLLDAPGTQRVLSAMGPVRMQHKFVKALAGRKGVRFLARKSGTWRSYHSDSALIEHGARRYAAVVLSEHRRGGAAVEGLIRIVDDLIAKRKMP